MSYTLLWNILFGEPDHLSEYSRDYSSAQCSKESKRADEAKPVLAYVDKKNKKFVVKFDDGTAVDSVWEDSEYFDHYLAYAYCLAKKKYGSSTKMRAEMDKIFRGAR